MELTDFCLFYNNRFSDKIIPQHLYNMLSEKNIRQIRKIVAMRRIATYLIILEYLKKKAIYDELNRLRFATSQSYAQIEYRYDEIGNITYNSRVGLYTRKRIKGTVVRAH